METTISKSIRSADDRANYDAACKRLLSEKIILAWIVKSCLEEFRDYDVEDIASRYIEGEPQVSEVPVAPDETNAATVIHGIGTEDATQTEGTVTYDIRFLASLPSSNGKIRMILNVEGQNDFYPGYPILKRGIYYCSRMISAQYGTEFTHSQYQKIKKVYSIWVCMAPPEERRNSITRYRLVEENLAGTVKEPVRNYDLLSVVMLCLGGADEENYNGVLKLLDVLLSSEAGEAEKKRILQDDFNIPMTQTLETEVQVMCNLSQGVLEKGKAEGLLSAIKNLMANTGWPLEKAMETLGVSEAERSKYADLLQKQ